MSRRRHLAQALTSGAVSTLINAAYSLISIPLALSYLETREFGMWALTTQIVMYLTLIDSSLSASISRLIIESKDSPQSEEYGKVVATTRVVTRVQGLLAFVVGTGLALAAPTQLDIPTELHGTMLLLLLGQVAVFSAGLGMKAVTHFLIAHQRYDIVNYSMCLGPAVLLGTQWIGFRCGWGVYSLLAASTANAVISQVWLYVGAKRCGAMPPRNFGKFDKKTFREFFTFGMQLFAQVLGWQLLSASQLIVVTKLLGLEAAAIYATCSKTMMIAQQLVFRVFDFSIPALSEMSARGEHQRLERRFLDLTTLCGVLAAWLAFMVAACNGPFVRWWTHGRIEPWAPVNDWLLAALTFAYAVNRVHGGLAWIIKDVRHIRFIFPLEGLCVIAIGALAVWIAGIPGVLAVSVVASFLFSGLMGTRASHRGIGVEMKKIFAAAWGRPVLMLAIFAPIAIGWTSLWRHLSPIPQCVVISLGLVPAGALCMWFIGLTPKLRSEIHFGQRR